MSTSYDVIVVGGGPVGLSLAIELGWNGISVLLAEMGDGVPRQPKMDILSVRTMEFARRWGITDQVLAAGYNRDHPQDCVWVTSLTGYELGREPFPSPRLEPIPPESPEKRERCPQNFFDPVLQRFAAGLPNVTLKFLTRFTGMREAADGVVAEFLDLQTNESSRVEATYLVGCDGGASTVREQLGITTAGGEAMTYTTNVIFRCPGLDALHGKPPAYRFIMIGPEGTWGTIVAIDGRDTYRFSLVGDANKHKPSVDELRKAITRGIGKPVDFEILSTMPWVRREMVANRYRRGRAFIAGDAAHLNSPTGGFGMNTGIQDAVDLGWKLAAVLKGWGGPRLLDSYEAERRPIAHRNVKEATTNLQRMLSSRSDKPSSEVFEDGPEGDAARKRYGDGYTEMMKPEWFTIGLHLGYRYNQSPVIEADGTTEPADTLMTYHPTARPGHLVPHAWIQPERSTLDCIQRELVLFQFGAQSFAESFAEVARHKDVPLHVVRIDNADIAHAYGDRPFVLVRPDGIVAWRGEPASEAEVARIIDKARGVPHA